MATGTQGRTPGFTGSRKVPAFALAFLLTTGSGSAWALPRGGAVLSGSGTVHTTKTTTIIHQVSNTLSLSWSSFNITQGQTVQFIQPGFSSVALNFIGGTSPSQIYGALKANGQVFLMNPYGIIFGPSSQVNVGGLVAAAMNLQKYGFGSQAIFSGNGTVSNAGTILARPGGYVALVGGKVTNSGTIGTPMGTISLAGGNEVSLDFSGNSLVNLVVDQNTTQSVIDNGGILSANGGRILLKAGAQNSLEASVVNNTGTVEARTMAMRNGEIVLLSGLEAGTTNVAGTLDASAQGGGNGGIIETSGNRVNISGKAVVTTSAPDGTTGTWTLDPASFYIGMNTGTANSTSGNVLNYEDISGMALGTALDSTNVVIDSTQGAKGALGNIYVNDPVSWSSANSLTLNAVTNVNVNHGIVNSGTGNIVLTADDMEIGGAATNSGGGGIPSGVGTVNIASGMSVRTEGNLSVYSNPANFGSALDNPVTQAAYANGNGSGTVTAYDLLSSNGDLYWIDQNQTSRVLSNNYALNSNLTLPTVTSGSVSGADLSQAGYATQSNTGAKGYTQGIFTNSNWAPFGEKIPFSGNFNGLNHTISNLTIDDTTEPSVGLFGIYSGPGRSIRNLGLLGGMVSGKANIGDLVGDLTAGTIAFSYATGSVSGHNVKNNAYPGIGGLVGTSAGTITNSYATGSVTAQIASDAGGLVGNANSGGTVTDSYATGSVTAGQSSDEGGIAGKNDGTISDSYASGNVTGNGSGGKGSWYSTGGFVGYAQSGSILDSYSAGRVGGTDTSIGGFIGYSSAYQSGTYFDTTTSGRTNNACCGTGTKGITGLTSFTSPSQFSSFSFNSWNGTGFDKPVGTDPWFWGTIKVNGVQIPSPILVADMSVATVTANNAVQVYSGAVYTGFLGVTQTVSMGGSPISTTGVTYTQGTTNVGTTFVTPGGLSLPVPTAQSSVASLLYDSGTLTITPATLSATGTQVYNGTTSLAGSTLTVTGVNGQTFSASGSGVLVNSGNVQGNQTLSGLGTLFLTGNGGSLLSNYDPLTTGDTSVSITPVPLSLATTLSRTYDGTTSASLTSGNTALTPVSGQTASLDTAVTGSFSQANMGTNLGGTLPLTGADLTGNPAFTSALAANDYILPTTFTGGAVTPATLTYTAHPSTSTYGTTPAGFSGTVTGFVAGQTLSSATTGMLSFTTPATFSSNVGQYSIVGAGLSANNGNYLFVQAGGNATALTIVPANLSFTGSLSNPTRPYDGTTTAILTTANSTAFLSGFANGQGAAYTGATGTLASANAGPENVTATLGAADFTPSGNGFLWSNYSVPSMTLSGTGTISPRVLSLSGSMANPTMAYNGGTSILLTPADSSATLSGFVSGQEATYTGATGTFASPDAGTGIGVTASVGTGNFRIFSGTVWTNYSFGGGTLAGTGTITQPSATTIPSNNILATSSVFALSNGIWAYATTNVFPSSSPSTSSGPSGSGPGGEDTSQQGGTKTGTRANGRHGSGGTSIGIKGLTVLDGGVRP